MNLVLVGPLKHDGTVYLDGAFVPLSPKQAEPLILLGIVGESLPEPVEEGAEIAGDGTGVSLPPLPEEETPEGDPSPPLLVNLNTATNAELQALPFIGKGLAARIERARPIESLDSMPDLLGLGAEQWAELSVLVTV